MGECARNRLDRCVITTKVSYGEGDVVRLCLARFSGDGCSSGRQLTTIELCKRCLRRGSIHVICLLVRLSVHPWATTVVRRFSVTLHPRYLPGGRATSRGRLVYSFHATPSWRCGSVSKISKVDLLRETDHCPSSVQPVDLHSWVGVCACSRSSTTRIGWTCGGLT